MTAHKTTCASNLPDQEIGDHPYNYVDEEAIEQDLECCVCLRPFVKPVYVDCCGLNYCLACIPLTNVCVSCRGAIQPTQECTPKTHRLLLNALGKLPVYCRTRCDDKSIEQCPWQGPRDNLEDHFSHCEYRIRRENEAEQRESETKLRQIAETCLLLNPPSAEVVKLNVRGTKMFATRRLLTKQPHSKLAALFSPHHELQTDGEGRVLLDVDPRAFSDLLNYFDVTLLPLDQNAQRLCLMTAVLLGIRFSGPVLRSANLSFLDLSEADFTDTDLTGANLKGSNLTDAIFIGANLSGAILSEANLTNATFAKTTTASSTPPSFSFGSPSTSTTTSTGFSFGGCSSTEPAATDRPTTATFSFGASTFTAHPTTTYTGPSHPFSFGRPLASSSTSNSTQNATSPVTSTPTFVVSDAANLTGANLDRANLSWANLAYTDLTRAQLNGANLTGANLSHATLAHASLQKSNLVGANLTHANFQSSNPDSRARFAAANLTGANLTLADLASTQLTGAILTEADLTGANITNSTQLAQANLYHARMSENHRGLVQVFALGRNIFDNIIFE
eukprot:TRINITY_DN1109_c3_g1_i1.p1 TRINITY_DN1109_c3_g1~~TRINITY_DN1109_c3_g1_i1.p1  ORF type:complete len:562 (+),score=82.26 TRINITY_DN1109_c3_g1_i1:160-1845(+)